MTETGYRYTVQDFNDISQDGFDYTINEDTLDIISALASQVGAPDYVRTPNFTTHHRDSRGRGERRRRRQQDMMSDSDWEDLRSFHSKPKAEISPEKALEKKLRGELNKVVRNCGRSQLGSIAGVICELIDAKIGDVAEKVFFDLATCSKMNTNSFALLLCDLIDTDNYECEQEDELVEFLTDMLRNAISEEGRWMKSSDKVDYISEEEDYDGFCDVNKVNDNRLNTTRFISQVFKTFFEREDKHFFWFGQLATCYWSILCGFKDALQKEGNEDVAMVYCSNIVELLDPIKELVDELDEEHNFWSNAVEDQEQIIVSGEHAYPSLSRQIVFALQGTFSV